MFCDLLDVEKPQRVPLSVFRHCETLARQARHSVHFFEYVIFSKENAFEKFRFSSTVKENTRRLEVFLLLLNFGYGADLGRSRLVVLTQGLRYISRVVSLARIPSTLLLGSLHLSLTRRGQSLN